MKIYVNGDVTQIPESMDMEKLLEQMELTGQRIAVEINEELLPRSAFHGHLFKEADRVEIIHAVGGG